MGFRASFNFRKFTLWTGPWTTPMNQFSYMLAKRLLVSAKIGTLHCANVTDLGSGSGASYIITHCYFLCCGHTVYERPASLQEVSKFLLFPFCYYVGPILPWVRELVPGFVICLAELQIQTSSNELKAHLP